MIENRPILTFLSHLFLVIGVVIVAFPVYVTFVASSLAVDEVLQSPMPMLPGSHLLENFAKVLTQGASTNVTTAPVGRMMFNSLVSALVIAIGKIAISLLSADRKSTRLNSSHQIISYAVFCLKKKNTRHNLTATTISQT